MARKLNAQEPLLVAAARTLGKAAGTLVNMTQILTTEPTPLESRSSSQPDSKPESIQPESSNQQKSSATIRQNQPKKQSHAVPKKRTAKSRKASARNTIATKRGSRRKP